MTASYKTKVCLVCVQATSNTQPLDKTVMESFILVIWIYVCVQLEFFPPLFEVGDTELLPEMNSKLPSTTNVRKSHFCRKQAHVVEQSRVVQDLTDFTEQCTGEVDITGPFLSPVPEQALCTSPRLFPRTVLLFPTRRILNCLNMD